MRKLSAFFFVLGLAASLSVNQAHALEPATWAMVEQTADECRSQWDTQDTMASSYIQQRNALVADILVAPYTGGSAAKLQEYGNRLTALDLQIDVVRSQYSTHCWTSAVAAADLAEQILPAVREDITEVQSFLTSFGNTLKTAIPNEAVTRSALDGYISANKLLVDSLTSSLSSLNTLASQPDSDAKNNSILGATRTAYEKIQQTVRTTVDPLLTNPNGSAPALRVETSSSEETLSVGARRANINTIVQQAGELSAGSSVIPPNNFQTSGQSQTSNSGTSFTQNTPPASAQATRSSSDNLGGLVPCTGVDCNLCHLGQLMQNIITFLVTLSISVAAAMFAYAGYLYVTGASNPSQIQKAHKIFKNVLIGFLVAISAWLVVNTILNTVFDKDSFFESGGGWFTLECVSELGTNPGQRLEGTNFGDLISKVIPQAAPPPTVIVQTSCPTGYTPAPGNNAYCVDSTGGVAPLVTEYISPQAFGSYSSIAAAAADYYGESTVKGPDGGNLACAWAVNNILVSTGISPVDGASVENMEQELNGGRGSPVSLPQAQAGDIIIWKTESVSHVGICENAGCTSAISNSSSNATFTNRSGSTFEGVEGRVYRVHQAN